jgi:glycosyltransferase involved in cell wall biosynthesis
VTVAICAYTAARYEGLKRAVAAVLSQLHPADELLLVIDHADELLDRARAELTDVRVVANAHTRGLSGARNTAIELAQGDTLVFLDDDAVPRAGWLDALLAPYADRAVVGVGGRLAPVWPDGAPPWFPPEFFWVVGCSYAGLPVANAAIRNPIGANMSVRRDAAARAGGFDEALGRVGTRAVGCEETLLGLQVTSQSPGTRIVYQPSAVADHEVTRERATFTYFGRRCWGEGISKARVSKLSDRRGTLSTERRYVARTLSAAVVRQLLAAARGDRHGLSRALAMFVGLTLTGAGYLTHIRTSSGPV